MGKLDGKVILVAGAGAIGSELSRRYAADGASVVVGDLNIDIAKTAVADIIAAGGTAIAIRLDGADEASLGEAVALCRDSYGGLDGAHLNYVAFEDNLVDHGVIELDMAVFDRLMHVNVRGFFLATRLILPELIAVLAQHERGLRRWSVMRAIRAARSKSAKPIPQKFEEQVERTFRRFSACATDGESRVCKENEAPFYRPAETAGEVWALHPDRAAAALDKLKTYQ